MKAVQNKIAHRAKVGVLGDVVADVLVLPGHGHDVDEGVPRLLPHVAVAVQEPHQQREHQEVAAAGVRGGRGGRRGRVVADGGVRVEEEAEQVKVLHEADAQLKLKYLSYFWVIFYQII